MIKLGLQSLAMRAQIVMLTTLSIAISVALMLGVERLRTDARASFANSASGLDLIVAPRGNDVQILMATVFGVGSTGPGLSWQTFEMIDELPQTAWAIPLSMGDNHRGFPVIGTQAKYFEHFRHSGGQALSFREGQAFSDDFEAVIGAQVANQFGYEIGTQFTNAHGVGAVSITEHDDVDFTVAGILEPTGTAVDRMVFVTLAGFDQMHEDAVPATADPLALMEGGTNPTGQVSGVGYQPTQINAVYVGLTNRTAILNVQRALSQWPQDPLTAVLPQLALLQLWSITGTAETALQLMAAAVAFAGMAGLTVMLMASLEGRRREFSILRAVGATPVFLAKVILMEAVLVTVGGILIGYVAVSLLTLIAAPIMVSQFGLVLNVGALGSTEVIIMLGMVLIGCLASLIPAWRVYRMTLTDGLTVKL